MTGVGPGLMDAAIKCAIGKEAGEWTNISICWVSHIGGGGKGRPRLYGCEGWGELNALQSDELAFGVRKPDSTNTIHSYLPSETYLTFRFFSARKHGLVDAAVRNDESDRTAVVALPGGIGTLDEIFKVVSLIQLERIGSELGVPFLLMNYDGFYSKMLKCLEECESWGTVSKGEVDSLWKVCLNNSKALAYLAEFYHLPYFP